MAQSKQDLALVREAAELPQKASRYRAAIARVLLSVLGVSVAPASDDLDAKVQALKVQNASLAKRVSDLEASLGVTEEPVDSEGVEG